MAGLEAEIKVLGPSKYEHCLQLKEVAMPSFESSWHPTDIGLGHHHQTYNACEAKDFYTE